jgi:CubicO group peptidase (beta-lactamase class C family)
MTSRRNFMKQAGLAAAGLMAPRLSLNAFAGIEDKRFQGLREAIAAHANFMKIPGLVAAVVENGKITFLQTEGFADLEKKTPMRRDHIFPVASITKTLSAVMLMQCEQEGKMSMDDYVLDYPYLTIGYFPEQVQNPNVKIKHVLSHTSEGAPGANYIYNGARYNMIYGAFENMSGNTKHFEAVSDEVTKRIIKPLNLKDTLAGYPADKNHPAIPRIVTTYNWDKKDQQLKPDKNLQGQTTLYPSAGLLTTIDDLAAYSTALDQNTLLTAESYKKMTSPFISINGHANPYGLGWATQQIDGRNVHWGYGYGDSYATLLVRIPQEKMTFILLSNSAAASEGFYLGSGGNVLQSAFGNAFFKHVVFKRNSTFNFDGSAVKPAPVKDAVFYDEVFCQVLMRYYAEKNYNEHAGEALTLLRYLAQNDPSRFNRTDTTLIYLLAKLSDPELKTQMENAIKAYVASGWFHPDIHWEIASWYDRTGNQPAAIQYYHLLADSKYAEQRPVRNSCNMLGKYYMKQGDKEKARDYYWRAALYGRYSSPSTDGAARQMGLMKAQ